MSGPTVERPFIALSFPANEATVTEVLESAVSDDGRSDFVWLRLASGDLILGVWPCGDRYESIAEAVHADYEAAIATGAESVCWMEDVGMVTVGPGVKPRYADVRFGES